MPAHDARGRRFAAAVLCGVLVVAAAVAMVWWLSRGPGVEVEARVGGADPMLTAAREGGPGEGRLVAGDGAAPADQGEQLRGWPQFRGPDRDGKVASAVGLMRSWDDPPRELWRVAVGEGYAGPIVVDGRVYLMDYDQQSRSDALRCLSLADGSELWRWAYPVVIKRNHGMSRTVPAAAEGCVVAMGPKCHVICVDAVTGELKWYVDLVEKYGTAVPDWYAGQCPLIDAGRVILAPGGDGALLVALDLQSGEELWRTANPLRWKMTHSSVMAMEHDGQRMFVYCGSGGVAGAAAEDGRLLWKTDAWRIPIATVPSPVALGSGRVFLTGGYNAGSMLLAVKRGEDGQWSAEVERTWTSREFAATQHTPIERGGLLYGLRPERGELVCMDPASGQVRWSSGRKEGFGLGPLLMAGDLTYVLGEDGRLVLAEATAEEYRKLGEAAVLEGHEAWGPMALAGGRLLVRDLTTLKCLEVGVGAGAGAGGSAGSE